MSEHGLSDGGIVVNLDGNNNEGTSRINVFPLANDKPQQVKTLQDLSLQYLKLEDMPVVKWWRERLFAEEGTPEICDELPRLLTEFLRSTEAQAMSPYTRRAQALNYIFSNKKALVKDTDLLPGQTTTSFVGPVIYVDTIGYCIWPELKSVSTRSQNPFNIKPEVAERLNKEIFPYWLNRKVVQEVARYSEYDTENYKDDGRDEVDGGMVGDLPSIDPELKKRAGETPKCLALMERVAFYLSDKATCVSHTVPDFGRALKYGLNGLINQANADKEKQTEENQREFLQGVITVFEGAKVYAEHLAEAAEQAGNVELAKICRKVPAEPAETLHEAVSTIWITYHLLLQENTK